MAYAAGDGFLPSWGPGMKPLEPHDRPASYGTLKNAKSKSAECWDPCSTRSVPEKAYQQAGELPLYGSGSAGGYGAGYGTSLVPFPKPNNGSKSACLLALPLISGLVILYLFNFMYWKHEHFCSGVFIVCALVGLVMCIIGSRGGVPAKNGYAGGYSAVFCGVTGGCQIFISVLALILGVAGYSAYMRNFHIYNAARSYDLVVPSANPAAYRDAGVIEFTADAHIDHYKGAGYRKDVTYCAAPIVGYGPSSYVGFWAVGVGCCGQGYFKCGDVFDHKARGGLVVLDATPQFHQDIPMFMKAAEESAARAGLAMPPEPIFIYWTAALDVDIAKYQHGSTFYAMGASLGIIAILVLTVVALTMGKSKEGLGAGGLADKFYSSINLGAPDPMERDSSPQARFTGHGERLNQPPPITGGWADDARDQAQLGIRGSSGSGQTEEHNPFAANPVGSGLERDPVTNDAMTTRF